MVKMQVSEYRFLNGEMVAVGNDSPNRPHDLPDWKYEEDSRVFVISVRNGDGKDVIIKTDFSPCIIKGWKIYRLEKVRLIEGGMFNERKATFSIKGMEKNERQRIDILVWGPPEKVKIEVK